MEQLFEKEPWQWGLRGDSHLWYALRDYMAAHHQPKNEDEFEALLCRAFEELTGEELAPGKEIFIKGFDTGGMSSGYVSSDWWLDKGLPLLKDRFKQFS